MERKEPQDRFRQSIDLLNDAIGKEIATSMQYMYFHVRFEDAGYAYLARMLHRISIAEMRHIEQMAERVLYLGGDVEMNPSFRTRQIHDVPEALGFCAELETSTIGSYNAASRLCSEAGDAVSHRLFQETLVEEEEHHDLFRTELQNLLDYGTKEYLLQQSIAGSRERSRTASGEDRG